MRINIKRDKRKLIKNCQRDFLRFDPLVIKITSRQTYNKDVLLEENLTLANDLAPDSGAIISDFLPNETIWHS